jgi:hypothetical protein
LNSSRHRLITSEHRKAIALPFVRQFVYRLNLDHFCLKTGIHTDSSDPKPAAKRTTSVNLISKWLDLAGGLA